MSRNDASIEACYRYLLERLDQDQPFTVDDLSNAAGWTFETTRTNISKRLSEFVYRTNGALRVSPVLRRVSLGDFAGLFRQAQHLFACYDLHFYPHVIMYEFLLPLAHELRLRRALDDLFYPEGLRQRLEEIGITDIESAFGRLEAESDSDLLDRVIARAGDVFGGYSVYHVSGRFRAARLMSRADAAIEEAAHRPYLIDETTAVVRFIACFGQCATPTGEQLSLPNADGEPALQQEADEIRWLFLNVFADAVTRQVRQEDEIWLLESGEQSGLWIWRKS